MFLIQWDKTFQFSNIFLDSDQIKFLLSGFDIGLISIPFSCIFLKMLKEHVIVQCTFVRSLKKSKPKREFSCFSKFCNFSVNCHGIC